MAKNVYEALAEVQHRVSCPKGQYNKFGGFAYRSLEDINAALKPVCEELGCSYWFADEIVPMGLPAEGESEDAGRWYLKATVTFAANGCDGTVSATAYAREQKAKKGMDAAQITGLASSYARKYAACGLFAIDSGEDPDALDNGNGPKRPQKPRSAPQKPAGGGAPRPAGNMALEPATAAQMNEIVTLAGKVAEARGKTSAEVLDALNKTRSMAEFGVRPGQEGYDTEQAACAVSVLANWTKKSKED